MIKRLKFLVAPLLLSSALVANAAANSDICANLSGDWVGKANFTHTSEANVVTADIKLHILPRSGNYTYEVIFSASNVKCTNSNADDCSNIDFSYPTSLMCEDNHITMYSAAFHGSLNNNQIHLTDSDSTGEINLHR